MTKVIQCLCAFSLQVITFEKYKIKDNKKSLELFPDVQFYDYTKNYLRFDKVLPKNYHLTFFSETNHTKEY
jgi:hypothetical protein